MRRFYKSKSELNSFYRIEFMLMRAFFFPTHDCRHVPFNFFFPSTNRRSHCAYAPQHMYFRSMIPLFLSRSLNFSFSMLGMFETWSSVPIHLHASLLIAFNRLMATAASSMPMTTTFPCTHCKMVLCKWCKKPRNWRKSKMWPLIFFSFSIFLFHSFSHSVRCWPASRQHEDSLSIFECYYCL